MNMKGISVYGILPFLSTGLSNDGSFVSRIIEKKQVKVPGKYIQMRYLFSRFIRGGIRRFMVFMNIMSVKDGKK